MVKQKFSDVWPSYFMLDKIRIMIDKYARIDTASLLITYKVRDYHSLEYEKKGASKVWIEKKMTKEEAHQIFLDLYPNGSIVV